LQNVEPVGAKMPVLDRSSMGNGQLKRFTGSSTERRTIDAGNPGSVLLQSFASLAVTWLLMGAALFLSAGTVQWLHGWLFLAVFLLLTLVAMAWLSRVNPDIFVARSRLTGQGTKGWDRVILALLLSSFVMVLIVAGLDDGRFHWAPAPEWAVLLGYVLLLAGFFGTAWPQAVNRHFEPSVRVQSDRDHHVIMTGPYAYVRHPGYIFASILTFGLALALGSLWALLPALLVVVVFVIRTRLEDATLQRELPGYAEFAARVRYKWIPGVW
jgi:protein-S-isoprenylcysteine O-methyltransferase Ste14